MPVTIVEYASGSVASTATPSATLTTTPQAGDVIVIVLVGGQNASTYVSASGCGATYSLLYAPAGTTSGQRMFVAGTGATTSGTVTLTVSATRSCFISVYLVRGLTSTSVAGVNTGANSATHRTTGQTAGPGQIVLAGIRNNDTTVGGMTVPSSGSLPSAASWTGQTPKTGSFLGTGTTAYAIPSSNDTYAVEGNRAAGTAAWDISQIVLGTAEAGSVTTYSSLPFSVGLSGTARAVGATTSTLPFTVGLPTRMTPRPVPLYPVGGEAATSVDYVNLVWDTFAPDGSGQDTTAFQVQVERTDTSVLLYDSGKEIAPQDTTYPALGADATYVPLRWRVQTWGPSDAPYGWSEWATFTWEPAIPTESVDLPIAVGLTVASKGVGKTTATLPFTIGLGPTIGIASTTSTLPFTIALPVEATVLSGFAVGLEPWTDDLSQRTLLILLGADTDLVVLPALAVAPPNITPRMLRRHSVIMDPPEKGADGRYRVGISDYTVIEGDVGVPHITVAGKDVTYFRNAATVIGTITRAQPFGDRTLAVTFPQIAPMEQTGIGDLYWLMPGARVEVFIVDPNGYRTPRFAGHFLSQDSGNGDTEGSQTWEAAGALYQADLIGHTVPPLLDPSDIGPLIATELNNVVSRRYSPLFPVATGIDTRQRGSLNDSRLDYVGNLLSTAWLDDGSSQWTVARNKFFARQYRIRLKDRTTVHWTLTTGAPGVGTSLSRDLTGSVNCIYGRGVASNGYAWAGWMYPNLLADDAPPYPYSDPDTMVGVIGNSHPGVTLWQRRAVELGYNLVVDGVYNSADAKVAKQIQRDYGLRVDGIVGPQTWAATFDVGAAGGDLNAIRRPLAVATEVEPRLYSANGADVGPNPSYDPRVLRIERDIDYGPGVRKSEGTRAAIAELTRDSFIGWTGTITLQSDPREGSRFHMGEGENVRLLGFHDRDLLLHIVETSEDFMSGTVTLTVDEHARDAMGLAAIRARDRESAPDPARRPGNVNRRSRQTQDLATEFDGESGAGIIPRHAILGGLWTVIRIPVSQVGRIAIVDVQTQSPKAKFVLALFGNKVTPAHLKKLVGNPLTGQDPFARTEGKAIALDNLGFIEAFGGPDQAAGYWPRSEDSDGAPITGRLLDTGGVEYVSAKPPWVWVAEYSPTSTFISGRLWPAPIQ